MQSFQNSRFTTIAAGLILQLGPGFPEPIQATVPVSGHRHHLSPGYRVAKTGVLGGLHHEYRLEEDVA